MAQGIEKDNNQMLDEIFQAIDLITQKRLDTLQFDKTITCKIISAEYSDEGVYIVDDGSTQFLAYSENTNYSEGTWVYVTIPNGDFNLQKNIVGKYVSDNSEYSTYIDPFSTYLDITGNLVTEDSEVEHSLIANYSNEIVLWCTDSYKYTAPAVTVIDNLDSNTETTASQLSSFDRLGIQADFKTLLGKYNLTAGSYGLKLVIQTTDLGSSSTSQSITEFTLNLDTDSMFGNPYNYITWSTQKVVFDISNLENITAMKLVFFQNNDFINDTVSYEQVSVTISEYQPGVYFTKNGDVYTLDTGVWSSTKIYYKSNPYSYIPGYEKGTEAWNAYLKMANILAKNIYVSLGYDLKNFTKDTLLLYCFNGSTYSSYLTSEAKAVLMDQDPSLNLNDSTVINTQLNAINTKSLHLRWVHIDPEDESILAIDNIDDFETYEGENDALQVEAMIHWYRWNMMDGVEDPIAGAFWEEITDIIDPFNYDFIPNPTLAKEQIKVMIEYPSLEYAQYIFINYEEDNLRESLEEEIVDSWTSESKTYTAEELQTEIENRLKEYEPTYSNQNNLYTSNLIEFTNEQEVPNSMSVNLVKGLEILCDKEGLEGIYNIYTSDGSLVNLGEASRLRFLTAQFNTIITGDVVLDSAESIAWYIPVKNTMIQPPALGYEYSENDLFLTDGEWYIIKREGVVASTRAPGSIVPTELEQAFRIQSYYSQTSVNNTIRCEVYKNNYIYSAEYTMEFGIAGSNGTDYTLTVTYQVQNNNIWQTATLPCLNIVNGAGSLKVIPHIFDYEGNDITEDLVSNISYSWYTRNPSNLLSINQNGIISTSGVTDLSQILHYILKITVSNAVALGNNNSINLTAYCPIAVQSNNNYQGFDGDNRITYDNSGVNPTYYKGQYCLYKKDINNKLIPDNNINWSIIIYGETSNSAALYYPQISTTGYLTVPGMYLSDNESRVSLIARLNGTGTIVWGQPLYISKYIYSSAFLNGWDGGLNIDEENGTIMSTMMGAGYKDNENRFNGVLMGDVQTIVNDISEVSTGLYGYNEGELSFGLDIDGTAFLGKNGHGRILFDGNSGEIKSALFEDDDTPSGLRIDIDNAYMDFVGLPYYNENSREWTQASVHIGVNDSHDNESSFFRITDTFGSDLVLIDPENRVGQMFIQSSDFTEPDEENGKPGAGIHFDLYNGRLIGYNFDIYAQSVIDNGDGTYSSNGYIALESTAEEYPLIIGDPDIFSVKWDGSLFATKGFVGGWQITSRGLFSDTLNFDTGYFDGIALFSPNNDSPIDDDPLRISVGSITISMEYYICYNDNVAIEEITEGESGTERVIVKVIISGSTSYYATPILDDDGNITGYSWTEGGTSTSSSDEYEDVEDDEQDIYADENFIWTQVSKEVYLRDIHNHLGYIDYLYDTNDDAAFTVSKSGILRANNAIFPIATIGQGTISTLITNNITINKSLVYASHKCTLAKQKIVYAVSFSKKKSSKKTLKYIKYT